MCIRDRTGTYAGSITLDDNDPAGLALDPVTAKMYVVLGATSRVAVIDLKKREVVATWPITGGPLPHALALDAAHHLSLIHISLLIFTDKKTPISHRASLLDQ